MKLKSFILSSIALLGFAGHAVADTTKLLEAEGWTKITTLPTASDIANNYYVFVDNANDLMLGVGKGVNQNTAWYSLGVYYYTSVEPNSAAINNRVWTLETQGDGFAMRNLEYSVSPFQTEWKAAWKFDTNDVYGTANDWCKVLLAYTDGAWTIQNGYYPGSGYLGPWNDSNFTNGAECAANKTGANMGRFQIYTISRDQFKQNLLDNASESNPVDLTPWYVTNATFDANTSEGWETTFSANSSNWWGSHSFKYLGAENYQQVAEVKQTLTLPKGKYKVALQGATNNSSFNQAYVFGSHNGEKTKAYISTSTVNKDYNGAEDDMMANLLEMIKNRSYGQTMTAEINVTTGSLTIGYANESGHSWDVFDNFKLYCTGLDLSAYVEQLASVVADCNDFIGGGFVPEACEAAIESAITTYNKSYETPKEYSVAIVALSTVLNTYRNDAALLSAYADYYAFKTKVEKLMVGVSDGSTKTTFTDAIAAATTRMEAATTVAAITAQKENIRAAAMTFISTTDGSFDITFLASQNYADWKKADGSAAGIVQDKFLSNRPSEIPAFAESFEWTASTTGNVLYQTVTNLPEGYYQVGMYAMALSTSQRDTGITTEAMEGDADRSFAFAGDQRTGLPVKFAAAIDFSDLTTLDVNVHLSATGDLTFGVQKDKNGSNWHFAQIASIIYSNAPDLTSLLATRDALVSEAEGLLGGASDYLTSAQQTALRDAIDDGKAADDFDRLNTVTLTTLPDAINTAQQQVQIVKDNRVLMLAALERFENDYNLADGTDYRRLTMSADAWATLLAKVAGVSEALDDVSQSTSYGTLCAALTDQMDATDASLRLFKSYKAMVGGTHDLGIAEAATYAADSHMDDDAAEQAAIAALNTAFGTYVDAQDADFDVSAFLGENLDFSAAEGAVLNNENSNNIHAVAGWDVAYADADTWAVVQTSQTENAGKLYIRKNWGSAATTLTAAKQRMLPVGKYRLSFSWNSTLANMTNRSHYQLGDTPTSLGEATSGAKTLEYEFEVTDAPQPFDLVFGFQKSGTDNTPAQLVVDDIVLTFLRPAADLLARDYDPAALWFDATDAKYASATGVVVTPAAPNQIIKAASATQFSGITQNLVVGGSCANLVITDGAPLQVDEAFTATTATYTRTMSNTYGTVILPFPIESNDQVQLYVLRAAADETMSFVAVDAVPANTPVLFAKLDADAGSVSFTAADASVAPTDAAQNDATEATGWTSEGSYTVQSIAYYDGIYYIASNQFWAADGTVALNPFRTIFRAVSPLARAMRIAIFDPDAMTVQDVPTDALLVRPTDVYDLGGRLLRRGTTSLSGLQPGFYLINGQKILIR